MSRLLGVGTADAVQDQGISGLRALSVWPARVCRASSRAGCRLVNIHVNTIQIQPETWPYICIYIYIYTHTQFVCLYVCIYIYMKMKTHTGKFTGICGVCKAL